MVLAELVLLTAVFEGVDLGEDLELHCCDSGIEAPPALAADRIGL